MQMMPLMFVLIGSCVVLGMVLFAFAGPSTAKAQTRRVASLRERHGDALVVAEAQMRRIANKRDTKMDLAFGRILPNLLADKVGPFNMFVPCAGISAILIIVLQSVKQETGFIVYAAAYGFISGSFVSLPPVVVASITKDFSRLGSRLGVAFAFCSFSVLVGPPISGAIITSQGGKFWGAFTYAGVVGITGVMFVAASRATKTGMNWLVKA